MSDGITSHTARGSTTTPQHSALTHPDRADPSSAQAASSPLTATVSNRPAH